MWEQHKHFILVMSGAIGIWLLSWLLVLSPAQATIAESRRSINYLSKEITAIYADNFSPNEEAIEKLEKQNRTLERKFENLVKILHHSHSAPLPAGANLVAFRLHSEKTLEKLRHRANQLGITFAPNLDKMGFGKLTTVEQNHWRALELATKIISALIEVAASRSQLQSISDISYPGLTKPIASNVLVAKFPIEITFIGKLRLAIALIHRFSDKASFFQVKALTISHLPDKSDEMVQVKLRLASLSVNPEGKVAPTSAKTTQPKQQTVPIWERY